MDLFYKRMNDMIESIKNDRADMNVVYEVMLKMGVLLDVKVQYMEINDKIAYHCRRFYSYDLLCR